jgi:hypothetical protein
MQQQDGIQNNDMNLVEWLDELECRLREKLRGRIRNLQLVLEDWQIVMRGSAATYHAKQLAQHALLLETDLPIKANEIQVC